MTVNIILMRKIKPRQLVWSTPPLELPDIVLRVVLSPGGHFKHQSGNFKISYIMSTPWSCCHHKYERNTAGKSANISYAYIIQHLRAHSANINDICKCKLDRCQPLKLSIRKWYGFSKIALQQNTFDDVLSIKSVKRGVM